MESVFCFIAVLLVVVNISMNVAVYLKLSKSTDALDVFNSDMLLELMEKQHSCSNMIESLCHIQNNLDRSVLSLKELLDNAKPMKSNNWDSVNRALHPTKVNMNERN